MILVSDTIKSSYFLIVKQPLHADTLVTVRSGTDLISLLIFVLVLVLQCLLSVQISVVFFTIIAILTINEITLS